MTDDRQPMTDEAEGLADVDEVIEAEATEDTGDFDEPQAGEVEEAEGRHHRGGRGRDRDRPSKMRSTPRTTESLEAGLSGTAEADTPPRRLPTRPRSADGGR